MLDDHDGELWLIALVTALGLVLTGAALVGIGAFVAWLWTLSHTAGFIVLLLLGFGLLVVTIAGVLSA